MEHRQGALISLQGLLDTLDEQGPTLGINSYGISDTSLEEIFLKVAEQADHDAEEINKPGNSLYKFCHS